MKTKNAVASLNALAHEGRLNLFRRLVQAGPDGLPAGDLARRSGINFTTASAQLAVLSNAGMATRRRDGRSVIYAADYGAIRSLMAFLMEDCCRGRPEILAPLADIATKAACCAASKGARK